MSNPDLKQLKREHDSLDKAFHAQRRDNERVMKGFTKVNEAVAKALLDAKDRADKLEKRVANLEKALADKGGTP